MLRTKENFQIQLETYINRHYDRVKNVWNTADPAASKALVRLLRNEIRMIEEEEIINGIPQDVEKYKQFMPLVSRRKHPELWATIGKLHQDGYLITFEPASVDYMTCNCTKEQFLSEFISDEFVGGERITDEDIRSLRELHCESLNATDGRPVICVHPRDVDKFQCKHTIGNWHCKSCLTSPPTGTILTTSDANNALSMLGKKALEWCPRFIPLLREKPFSEYLHFFAKNGNTSLCYAGLLHSEIIFDEVEGKKFVVIKKKCDTCDYTSEERKEYTEPEQVKANDLLVKF